MGGGGTDRDLSCILSMWICTLWCGWLSISPLQFTLSRDCLIGKLVVAEER